MLENTLDPLTDLIFKKPFMLKIEKLCGFPKVIFVLMTEIQAHSYLYILYRKLSLSS